MVLVEIFVEHAQPADGVAAFVREERVADGIPLSERAQRLDRVVADGERRHVAAGQLAGNLLQLDQLHLAEGSPSGAAMEYDKRLSAAALVVQIDAASCLVGQDNIRKQLPELRPHLGVVLNSHASLLRGSSRPGPGAR